MWLSEFLPVLHCHDLMDVVDDFESCPHKLVKDI
jgi:hypothetical protein